MNRVAINVKLSGVCGGVAKVLGAELWKKGGKVWGKVCGLPVGKSVEKLFAAGFGQLKGGKVELCTNFWTGFPWRFTHGFERDFSLLGGEFSTFST